MTTVDARSHWDSDTKTSCELLPRFPARAVPILRARAVATPQVGALCFGGRVVATGAHRTALNGATSAQTCAFVGEFGSRNAIFLSKVGGGGAGISHVVIAESH